MLRLRKTPALMCVLSFVLLGGCALIDKLGETEDTEAAIGGPGSPVVAVPSGPAPSTASHSMAGECQGICANALACGFLDETGFCETNCLSWSAPCRTCLAQDTCALEACENTCVRTSANSAPSQPGEPGEPEPGPRSDPCGDHCEFLLSRECIEENSLTECFAMCGAENGEAIAECLNEECVSYGGSCEFLFL